MLKLPYDHELIKLYEVVNKVTPKTKKDNI